MTVDRKHLLTSVEMAHFVAHGSLALEGVVPDALNGRAIAVLEAGLPDGPYAVFKIRFNRTVRQLRLWNTDDPDDLDDAAVRVELSTVMPWATGPEGRLELANRTRLWRVLTGDAEFDIDDYSPVDGWGL